MSESFERFLEEVLMQKCTERQKYVVRARLKSVLGIGENSKTLAELGEEFGFSSTRARHIMLKAKRKIMGQISEIGLRIKEPQVIIKYIEKPQEQPGQNLPIVYKPIQALGEFSVRASNCLRNMEIRTVQQLIEKKGYELLKEPNFGPKSLNEVIKLLEENNLKLGMEA